MAIAETAKLVSSLELKDNFTPAANKAIKSLGRLESTSFRVGQQIGKGLKNAAVNLAKIGAVAAVSLAGAVALGIKSLGDLQRTTLQTEAVIKSTGGAAGVTATQVRDLAGALEDVTTVDDKVIQDGENLLLTFTNIGKDVFPQATKAALDMAVAFAGGNVENVDLKASAIQLGKALNDPAAGFTALKKAGVSFNDAQIKILKGTNALTKEQNKHYQALLKTDKGAAKRYADGIKAANLLKSQKLILAELNKEFGKAGEAAGKGPEAVMRRLKDAGEGLSQVLARGLLPVLEKFGNFLNEKLRDPAFLHMVDDIGQAIGEAGDKFLTFIQKVDFNGITKALQTAAGFAGTLIDAFLKAPTWLQTAVITGWGLNKLTGGAVQGIIGELASGLVKGVLGINAGVVKLTAGTVVGGGGGLPGAAAGGGGLSLLGVGTAAVLGLAVAAAFKSAFQDPAFKEQTDAIDASTKAQIDNRVPLAELQRSLDATKEGIYQLGGKGNPVAQALSDILYGGQVEALKATQKALEDAIALAKIGPGIGSQLPGKPTRVNGVIPGTSAAGNMEARRGAMGDRLSTAEIAAGVRIGTKQGLGPDIESLRGAILLGLQQPAKTAAQANAILAAGAQRDAETSSSIATLVAEQAKATDIEALRGKVSDGLATLDTSTITSGQNMTSAARNAGVAASNAAYGGAYIVAGAVAANRPITNVTVNVSATTVQKTVDVITRYGPSGGDRDSDGGGGPGQG